MASEQVSIMHFGKYKRITARDNTFKTRSVYSGDLLIIIRTTANNIFATKMATIPTFLIKIDL